MSKHDPKVTVSLKKLLALKAVVAAKDAQLQTAMQALRDASNCLSGGFWTEPDSQDALEALNIIQVALTEIEGE